MNNLTHKKLKKLYIKNKKSSFEIAKILNISETGVNYWLKKFKIQKRTLSEAIYVKHNPAGDPFKIISPKNLDEAKLFGLGVGLYWGEGTKADKGSVRLGNSDPALMRVFIKFLIKFFNIKKSDLKFHLHTFTDINLRNEPSLELVYQTGDVEVYPIISSECKKCGHDKVYFWTMQTRATDEAETKFFKCTKCEFTWREYR